MAEIKEMLSRAKKLFNSDNLPKGKKLTPNEVELMSFEERERQDNVTRKLLKFRKQNAMMKDFNPDKHFGDKAQSILGQKNTLNVKSTFNHKSTLFNDSKKKEQSILKSSKNKEQDLLGFGGNSLW